MSTKNEIVSSLLNTVRGGLISTSEPITEEQLSWEIDNIRAKLIRQDLNKKRSINPDLIQFLCAEVSLVDATDCPCLITGCNILRTILQIPSAIEVDSRNLILSVGPVLSTARRFSLIPYERALYYNPSKFSQAIPAAFLHNGFIYLISSDNKTDMLENITIQIILERPEEASVFLCSGVACYTNDSKYPVSAAMIPDIQNMILANILKIEASSPNDKSGDIQHNLQPNTDKNLI